MTKRRPTNKKPTGANKSLGNSLCNERERNRKKYKIEATEDDLDNPAFIEEEIERALESKTFESNVEELFAKAELAGLAFNAERGYVHVVDKDSTIVVKTKGDVKPFNELQEMYSHLLKIPRRPGKHEYSNAEELHEAENEMFLRWRTGLSELEEMDGVVLTPFERNLDIWRELWRVVERSDLVVQIVDARNPLLFRSSDLEDYVTSVDPAKKNLILVNKADLLLPEQVEQWASYFHDNNIDAIFWSAVDSLEPEEGISPGTSSDGAKEETNVQNKAQFLSSRDELVDALRKRGGRIFPGGKPLVVGFVGYPNVGKSSTINKLIGMKKVTVSATPGKTKRLQTIILDEELTLCDCPGLVMPSFAFDKNEMFLNGIIPVEQMRDHFGPTSLLMSRVPARWIADRYSLTLPDGDLSSVTLLTAIAFMRGLMSSSGIPDCSRAARVLTKEVVCGSILWVAAPPSIEQAVFDATLFPEPTEGKAKGAVQVKQLEKRGLIETRDFTTKKIDSDFFTDNGSNAHIRFVRPGMNVVGGISSDKKHFKNKDKLRRTYPGMYA